MSKNKSFIYLFKNKITTIRQKLLWRKQRLPTHFWTVKFGIANK